MLRKHWQDDPTNSPLFLMWATCEFCDTESDQVSHVRGGDSEPELTNACTDCVDFYRRRPGGPITYVDER